MSLKAWVHRVGGWWTRSVAPEPPPPEVRESLRANAQNLLGAGPPSGDDAGRAEFFELYKIIVESSEKLVARRQGVNTFFLTINGLLMTAMGLFVQADGRLKLQAGGVAIIAVVGLTLCQAWRSLLVSFGQLNTGKFVVITAMEKHLAAPIYAAEWVALGRGDDPRVYRSFTSSESDVPILLGLVYLIAAVLGAAIWLGWWIP